IGPGSDGQGQGHGLTGMRERVTVLGGTLLAGPLPGHGFRVLARIPLAPPTSPQSPDPPVHDVPAGPLPCRPAALTEGAHDDRPPRAPAACRPGRRPALGARRIRDGDRFAAG